MWITLLTNCNHLLRVWSWTCGALLKTPISRDQIKFIGSNCSFWKKEQMEKNVLFVQLIGGKLALRPQCGHSGSFASNNTIYILWLVWNSIASAKLWYFFVHLEQSVLNQFSGNCMCCIFQIGIRCDVRLNQILTWNTNTLNDNGSVLLLFFFFFIANICAKLFDSFNCCINCTIPILFRSI